MPPAEYSLRLQRGITGGFAPPTPDAIYTITKALNNTDLFITAAVRPSGTPELQEFAPKRIPETGTDDLVEELHEILRVLPTEFPPGSEDIYGLDVSIAWGSEDLRWCNGGPEGCGGGTASSVQVTEEQKAKFGRAVKIVEELVGRGEAEAN